MKEHLLIHTTWMDLKQLCWETEVTRDFLAAQAKNPSIMENGKITIQFQLYPDSHAAGQLSLWPQLEKPLSHNEDPQSTFF